MRRDGLVERNAVTGEESRVSMRGQEFSLKPPDPVEPQPHRDTPPRRHRPATQPVYNEDPREEPVTTDADPDHPARHNTEGEPIARQQPHGRDTDSEKTRQRGTQYQQQFTGEAAKPTRDATPASADSALTTSRLQFAADEKPPEPAGKKLTQARRRAERADTKLERAREDLPTRRKPRLAREFDEGKGKMKRRLVFEEQVKTRRQHMKGPLPLRPVKGVANAGIGYAHKKLYGVEEENVGTKAAHRTEMAAEGALRAAYRLRKTRPYRRVERLRHKSVKANMKLSYQKALAENPKLKGNLVSRLAQKLRIRRQYAKAARDAKRAARAAKQAGSLASRAFNAVAVFISRHPVAVAIAGLAVLLMVMVSTMFSSCSSMASGGLGGYFLSSYVADEAEMNAAEQAYRGWERDLQLEIDKVEERRPGYDEYRVYTSGAIGHDPGQLMSYLTAKYLDFTFAEVQADLREIFAQQYTLTYEEVTETRYRDVPVLNPATGLPTGATTREPYDWHVLVVRLTARDFGDIVAGRLDGDQGGHYDNLIGSRGNRQYTGSPFAFDWLPYISCHFGPRVHPITGEPDTHLAADIAVPEGTEIIAAHDGVVTIATSHYSYGNYIAIDSGDGVVTKYAHCSRLLVSAGTQVKAGDVIALVGSTGDSTGNHLHFEVIVNGQYMNPVYFAETQGG